MAASEEMYAAGQQTEGADAGAQNSGGNTGGEDVQDADFEEVK
jgi:molecular chaperone DnaK